MSVGGQDVGGSIVKSQAYYANASKEFSLDSYGFIRATMGIATSKNNIGYMDGVIGSIEYQPIDYLQIAVDYDANAINFGIKGFTPENWLPRGWRLSGALQLYSSDTEHNEKEQWFSIGLTVPLSEQKTPVASHYLNTPSKIKHVQKVEANTSNTYITSLNTPTKKINYKTNSELEEILPALSNVLIYKGYESVSVGISTSGYAAIQIENNKYNNNEQDAIDEITQLIKNYLEEPVLLALTNQGVVIKRILIGLQSKYKNETEHEPYINHQYFSNPMLFNQVNWILKDQNSHHWLPRLILSPAISSLVGSEFGAFDYQLVLSSNLNISLWDGAMLDIRHLSSSLINTSDFDKGNFLYNRFAIKEGIDRQLIHQTITLPNNIFTKLSIGRIENKTNGWLSESRWASQDNRHRLTWLTGRFKNKDVLDINNQAYTHIPALLKYRYRYAPLNWDMEVTAGQYWEGDRGFSVRSSHWFGNVNVGLRYSNTQFNSANGKIREDFLSIGFSVPLGTKKSMGTQYGVQIRGTEEFEYNVTTSLTEKGTGNRIMTGFAKEPDLYHNLDRSYFNRDRF